MSRAELIYPLRKQMEREIGKIERDPYNRMILTRYYKVRSSEISLATLLADFIRLNQISKMLAKRFEKTTVRDLEDLIFRIDQVTKADSTKNKFRQSLKQFFRWMKGCAPGENPPETKWIRRKKVPLVSVTPADLPSFEKSVEVTECASNLRDKALFQCKLDAGCRIGEILTPLIEEVEFNDGGAIIYSDGKTGKAPLILTWSAKILAQWLNSHPFKNNPKAPLWVILERREPVQLSYAAAYQVFKKCVKKSGYPKRMWPHLFKHVSSTEDAARGMPDSYRRYKHHWTPNSRMPQVYEHLSKSIILKVQNETWNKVVGIKKEMTENEKPVEVLKKCERCEYENPRDSLYCNRCTYPLQNTGEQTMKKMIVEKMLYDIISSPERLEKLRTFLSENGKVKS